MIFLLEKTKKVALLFDYYGKLLTEKQQDIIKLYYYHDLSLGEIAEKVGISRQAVYDHLQRGEKLLLDYEEKLKISSLFNKLKYKFNNLTGYIKENPAINDEEKEIILRKLSDIKAFL